MVQVCTQIQTQLSLVGGFFLCNENSVEGMHTDVLSLLSSPRAVISSKLSQSAISTYQPIARGGYSLCSFTTGGTQNQRASEARDRPGDPPYGREREEPVSGGGER
jgi:hypothetical protein